MRNWWVFLKHNWLLLVGIMLLKSPPLSLDTCWISWGFFLRENCCGFLCHVKPKGSGLYRNQAPMQDVKHPLVGI